MEILLKMTELLSEGQSTSSYEKKKLITNNSAHNRNYYDARGLRRSKWWEGVSIYIYIYIYIYICVIDQA